MEIKKTTLFSVNDTIWFIRNSKMCKGTVKNINITADKDSIKVSYTTDKYNIVMESEAFNTKEGLVSELMSNYEE